MAVAEDILKDPYFADLDIDLSQFSEEEKTVILGVMQKAKVSKEIFVCIIFRFSRGNHIITCLNFVDRFRLAYLPNKN